MLGGVMHSTAGGGVLRKSLSAVGTASTETGRSEMSEQRVRFEGVSCSDRCVTVYFTIGDRLAKRVRAIRIPPEALLDADVAPLIDTAARRRLSVLWDATQDSLPWE